MAAATWVGVPTETAGARETLGSSWFVVARVVLVITLMAAPFAFGAVQPWAWSWLAVAAALLLVLWAAGSVRQRELAVFWSPLYIPALLFLLLGGLQLAGHSTLDPIATREAFLKLSTNCLFFLVAGQLGATASEANWRQFGLWVTVFVFVLAVFSILQFFSSQGLIYWSVKGQGWAFGPYVNHNHYAGLMEMLIPISVAYVASRPRHHPGRVILVFAASVAIVSLLLSGSRGGMLSLLSEVVILAAILYWRGAAEDWRRLARVGPLAILTVLLLFFWLDPGEISARLATVVRLARSTDVSPAQREAVALDSLRILRQHPWLGAGLGTFEVAYPQHQSFPSDYVWEHAHNDYAEALVESGFSGGLLILLALGIFLSFAFRGAADRLQHPEGKIQLGAALACCGLLVHSFFDFNLHVPANAAWFAVCAAAATVGLPSYRPTVGRGGGLERRKEWSLAAHGTELPPPEKARDSDCP
jgi:O-antigen ligase